MILTIKLGWWLFALIVVACILGIRYMIKNAQNITKGAGGYPYPEGDLTEPLPETEPVDYGSEFKETYEPQEAGLNAQEMHILEGINKYRAKNGLNAVEAEDGMCNCARSLVSALEAGTLKKRFQRVGTMNTSDGRVKLRDVLMDANDKGLKGLLSFQGYHETRNDILLDPHIKYVGLASVDTLNVIITGKFVS